MPDVESGETKATRQCWECMRRRLVCDHTLPLCKKCIKAGKECPGYDEQKPLKWVKPGDVTARRRKKKDSPPKVYTIRRRDPESIAPVTSGVPLTSSEGSSKADVPEADKQEVHLAVNWLIAEEPEVTPEAIELYKSHLATLLVQEGNAAWWHSLTSEEQTEHISLMATEAAACSAVGERIMQIGNQEMIKEVVERGQHWEAAMLLQSNRDPLAKLQRLLRVMEMNKLPSYDYLSNETFDVVQAVNYVNTAIIPDLKETDSLAPNPAAIHFPVWALHVLPPAMHYTTVCLSLNHYINSFPLGLDRATIASKRTKIYKYRGLAIQALNENIACTETRSSDLTISSILMFMAMEVQDSTYADWRFHASGMKQLIDTRGGFGPVLRAAPHLTSALVIFVLIVTFSNSLGPVSDHVRITEPLEQHIEDVEKVYSLIFPYILCPQTLFVEIIRINRLRQDLTTSLFAEPTRHALDAQGILARIEAFEPENWAQPGEHYNDWRLIGSIYQSSVALYCIMSLQSVAPFSSSLETNRMRTLHGERLFESLKGSVRLRQLKKFSVFPLCALGVEAGYHNRHRTRIWIERQLENHARLMGSSCPLKARAVLRRYWQRKKCGWDNCFDEPYTALVPAGAC